jgi:hypothetical protein
MAVTDEYRELKSQEKVDLFTELFDLKEAKANIDKRIKELEKGYKEEISIHGSDVFYILPNGTKFSIKKSMRKGGYITDKVDRFIEDNGYMIEDFKKDDTQIMTLRKDK